MLAIIRFIVVITWCLLICILGSIFSLFRPRNPKNVAIFGRQFSKLAPMFGLKVENRIHADVDDFGTCVYIANHQNNYDMVTATKLVQSGTVTVGKKSLIWIPFFGFLYWITGNILIDRGNRSKAHGTIAQVANKIKNKGVSVWMFPEGTRSRGRGLLPFKMGAFHAAIEAGVPIVPICVSNTHNKVKLNRWNNGYVLVEMLPPIDTSGYDKENARELAAYCYDLMAKKIAELDQEVAIKESALK